MRLGGAALAHAAPRLSCSSREAPKSKILALPRLTAIEVGHLVIGVIGDVIVVLDLLREHSVGVRAGADDGGHRSNSQHLNRLGLGLSGGHFEGGWVVGGG
jgi:hypothetical protein